MKINYAVRFYRVIFQDVGSAGKYGFRDNFCAETRQLKDGSEVVLFAIADGRGEYSDTFAAIASRTAIEVCKGAFIRASLDSITNFEDFIRDIFTLANGAIYEREQKEAIEMSSTLTIALIAGGQCYVGHVGNCRVYKLSEGRMNQITVDQSLIIRPMEASNGPVGIRSVITRRLGTEKLSPPSFYQFEIKDGDSILFCSDGLNSTLDDEDIRKAISASGGVDKIAEQLLDCAKFRDVDDDITVIFARAKEISKEKKTNDESPAKEKKKTTHSEKAIKTIFMVALLVGIAAIIVVLLGKQPKVSPNKDLRVKGGKVEEARVGENEPRFTIYSKVPINKFIFNNNDRTQYLRNNKGFVRLKKEANRFTIASPDLCSISLECKELLDVNIDYARGNIINIDSKYINIWVESDSTVTIKKQEAGEKEPGRTIVLIKRVKGELNINFLSPVETKLNIE